MKPIFPFISKQLNYYKLMILSEVRNNILYIIINREEKLNALNDQVMNLLKSEISKIYNDSTIYGSIITGAGEKSFVAGADLEEIASLTEENGQQAAKKGQDIFNLIENCPKPIIASVNGFALGGGCELAMACHIRVATNNAKFAQPEVNYGIIPGYGGSQRLPRLIGKGRAMEMILTSIMIDAQTALNWGLVNYVMENKTLAIQKSEELLHKIFEKSPNAISNAIKCINDGYKNNLDGYQTEVQLFGQCVISNDFKEGTRAFIEKRKPIFKQ